MHRQRHAVLGRLDKAGGGEPFDELVGDIDVNAVSGSRLGELLEVNIQVESVERAGVQEVRDRVGQFDARLDDDPGARFKNSEKPSFLERADQRQISPIVAAVLSTTRWSAPVRPTQ